jgi:threonine/homoserine/homoserine lactone efflux protein
MPSTSQLLTFMATSAVIIAIPGPSVIFLVSRALAGDRRAALMNVIGNSLGEYVQVLCVAIGIGALVEDSATAFTLLKVAGGLYLVYLGVRTFRNRGSLAEAMAGMASRRSGWRAFAEALTVGVTNPKTVIFLAAMLPQFVNRSGGSVSLQILLLGAIFSLIAILSDGVWVLLAGRLRNWFGRSPRRLELIGGTGGLAIIAVGTGLLVTGRKN